jgi:hypothetical protein
MTTTIASTRGRAKRRTRQMLLRLLAGLLIMTGVVFGTTLLAFTKVYGTADVVRARTAPAMVQLAIARAALVRADNAAIRSFGNCDPGSMSSCSESSQPPDTNIAVVHLAGPGEEFQNQIAIASQSLTRVAEDNMAGEAGSRTLQLVEGLLVTYAGLVEHAFRKAGSETLGVVDLWSASRLLYKQDGGILTQLDTLLDAQQSALKDQLWTSSTTARFALVFLVSITGGLFALLVIAQVVMRHRFRRRVNLWLVLATVLLVALSPVSSAVFVSQHRLEVSRSTLDQLVTDGRAQTSMTDDAGQNILRKLVNDACDAEGCGETARLFPGVQELDGAKGDVNDRQLTDASRKIGEQTAAASVSAGLEPLIYILAILVAAAIFLGFRPRLYEYRYRPR